MNGRLIAALTLLSIPFWALVIVGALYLLGVLT